MLDENVGTDRERGDRVLREYRSALAADEVPNP